MPKNECFIHEGEPSKFFAGLIKGKVSLIKTNIINKFTNEIVIKPIFKTAVSKRSSVKKNTSRVRARKFSKSIFSINPRRKSVCMNLSKEKHEVEKMVNEKILHEQDDDKFYKIVKENFDTDKYDIIEEELFRKGEGYCFGEWALIYNQPRSASVYTLEDCVFFTLNETDFKNSFLKCLNNSEANKKKFVLENLFPFELISDRQSNLYKNIIPITCTRNQIIFNENDNSDTLYIIYLGIFTFEKNIGNKKFNVLSLEKGSIVGLESLFEGEKSKYKCSLKLSSGVELGVIFSIKVNKLVPLIIQKMKKKFNKNYKLYLNLTKDAYLNNVNLQKKMFTVKSEEKSENEECEKQIIKFLNEDYRTNKKQTIKFKNCLQKKIDFSSLLLKNLHNNDLLRKNTNKILKYKNILHNIGNNNSNDDEIKNLNDSKNILTTNSNTNNLTNRNNNRSKTYIDNNYFSNISTMINKLNSSKNETKINSDTPNKLSIDALKNTKFRDLVYMNQEPLITLSEINNKKSKICINSLITNSKEKNENINIISKINTINISKLKNSFNKKNKSNLDNILNINNSSKTRKNHHYSISDKEIKIKDNNIININKNNTTKICETSRINQKRKESSYKNLLLNLDNSKKSICKNLSSIYFDDKGNCFSDKIKRKSKNKIYIQKLFKNKTILKLTNIDSNSKIWPKNKYITSYRKTKSDFVGDIDLAKSKASLSKFNHLTFSFDSGYFNLPLVSKLAKS